MVAHVVTPRGDASWFGIDFFVLNLVLYSAVFVPLERLFALRVSQHVFRRQWLLDLTYFFVNSLLAALMVYVFLVAAQATFIHANVRWEFRALQRVVATPAFHHWHHSAERESVDKNFSVHTPIWDLLFGTYYLPNRWPANYGLSDGRDVPARWLSQFFYPLTQRPRE